MGFRRGLITLGAAASAAFASAGVIGSPAVAAPPAGPSAVTITWNMCGNAPDNCDYTNKPRTKARAIAESAKRRGASVLLLQEVCNAHIIALREELPGWTVHPEFVRTHADGPYATCKGGDENGNPEGMYGTAIAVDGDYGAATTSRVDLPSPPRKEQRVAACAEQRSRSLFACSAHFSTLEQDRSYGSQTDDRRAQAKALLKAGDEAFDRGRRTILGGDFNVDAANTAGMLDDIYLVSIECDEVGAQPHNEATHGSKKLDYVFFDRGWFNISCDATDPSPNNLSDHRLLTAHATMR